MPDGLGMDSPSIGKLLVVEDHDLVRRLTVTMLEKADYEVIAAASGQEALDLLAQEADDIDCALIDLTMPGISGDELAAAIQASKPQQAIILMSAYGESMLADRVASGYRPRHFLQKPFTAEALVSTVRGAMSGSDAPP